MLLSTLGWLAALLPAPGNFHAAARDVGDLGSYFILTVPSFPNSPAVQLDDGRILLNTTGKGAAFRSDEQYGVVNSSGTPCTASGNRVFRCHASSATEASKFSFSTSKTLVHQNEESEVFYLCPQEDFTVWGVYLHPERTYGECFATSIHVSRTDAPHELRSSPAKRSLTGKAALPPSFKVHTVTEHVTETVALIETSTANCRLVTLPTLTPRRAGLPTNAPIKARELSRRAPGDLNKAWKTVRDTKLPNYFVRQGQIKHFSVALGENKDFATDEYYGCTVFVIVNSRGITIGHLTGERGQTCPLATPEDTDKYLAAEFERKVSKSQFGGDCSTAYAIITGRMVNDGTTGVPIFLESVNEHLGIPPANIRYVHYKHTTPLSEFGDPSDEWNPVQGRSLYRWAASSSSNPGSTWKIYLGNETPRLELHFNQEGRLLESGEAVKWAKSPDTSEMS